MTERNGDNALSAPCHSSYRDIHLYLQNAEREISSTFHRLAKNDYKERLGSGETLKTGQINFDQLSVKRGFVDGHRKPGGDCRGLNYINPKNEEAAATVNVYPSTFSSFPSSNGCSSSSRTSASIFPSSPKFYPIPPPRKRNFNSRLVGSKNNNNYHLANSNNCFSLSEAHLTQICPSYGSSFISDSSPSFALPTAGVSFAKSSLEPTQQQLRTSDLQLSLQSSLSVESLTTSRPSSVGNILDMPFDGSYSRNTTLSSSDRILSTSANSFNYINGDDADFGVPINEDMDIGAKNFDDKETSLKSLSSRNVYELDFRSTESVNNWLHQILAELNSLPSSSPPTVRRRQKRSDNLQRSDEAAHDSALGSSLVTSSNDFLSTRVGSSATNDNSAEGRFFRACSELRDIGRLSASTDAKNDFLRHKFGRPLDDRKNSARETNRSSYTWPLELIKSSSGSLPNETSPDCHLLLLDGQNSASTFDENVYNTLSTETFCTSSKNDVKPDLQNSFDFNARLKSGLSVSSPNLERRKPLTISTHENMGENFQSNILGSSFLETMPNCHKNIASNSCWPKNLEKSEKDLTPVIAPTKFLGSPPTNKAAKDANHKNAPFDIMNAATVDKNINFRSSTEGTGSRLYPFNGEFSASELNDSGDNFETGPAGSTSIRNVVARIIKLAENEISSSSKFSSNAFRRIYGGRSNENCSSSSTTTNRVSNPGGLENNPPAPPDYRHFRPLPPEEQQHLQQQSVQDCRDACTQTSPVSLSRSTSLTCVSEESGDEGDLPDDDQLDLVLVRGSRSDSDLDCPCPLKGVESWIDDPRPPNDKPGVGGHCSRVLLKDELGGSSSSQSDDEGQSPECRLPKHRMKPSLATTSSPNHRKSFEQKVHNYGKNNTASGPSPFIAAQSTDALDESLNLLIESTLSVFKPFQRTNASDSSKTGRIVSFSEALQINQQPVSIEENENDRLKRNQKNYDCSSPLGANNCNSDEQFITKFVEENLSKDKNDKLKLYWQEDRTVYDNLSSLLPPNNSGAEKNQTMAPKKPRPIDSPDSSASDFVEKVASSQIRGSNLASPQGENSPLADSESSPVLEKAKIAECFSSKMDQLSKNDASRSICSRCEAGSNLVQAAPEFQYKNPEDYERECQSIRDWQCCGRSNPAYLTTNNADFHRDLSDMDTHQTVLRASQVSKLKCGPSGSSVTFGQPTSSCLAGSLPALHQINDRDCYRLWEPRKKSCANFPNTLEVKDEKSSLRRTAAEKTSRQCCRWLRAAGFPQYAKLYEDRQFPIDLEAVKKDHGFLDADSLRALFRRLHVLNECAYLNIDKGRRSLTPDDESDEDQLPLSRRWKFVRKSRTWSRIDPDFESPDAHPSSAGAKVKNRDLRYSSERSANKNLIILSDCNNRSSHVIHFGGGSCSRECLERTSGLIGIGPGSCPISSQSADRGVTLALEDVELSSPKLERKLQRSHSERIKDKAKALVKRMDFRQHQKRRKSPFASNENRRPFLPKEIPPPPPPVVISPPILVDFGPQSSSDMVKLRHLHNFSTNNSKNRVVPLTTSLDLCSNFPVSNSDYLNPDSNSNSTVPAVAAPSCSQTEDKRKGRVFLKFSATPNSENGTNSVSSTTGCDKFHNFSETLTTTTLNSTSSSNKTALVAPVTIPSYHHPLFSELNDDFCRQEFLSHLESSVNVSCESQFRHPLAFSKSGKNDAHRGVAFDSKYVDTSLTSNNNNSTLKIDIDSQSSPYCISDSRQQLHSSSSEESENLFYWERRDSGVGSSLSRSPSAPIRQRVKWHSFQRQRSSQLDKRVVMGALLSDIPIHTLSLTQFVTLQKYALLKLTALMEKYSPSMKPSGWQFGVQKLLKRIKHGDQKIAHENQIFGVSLCTVAQRTGQPLPQCILHAIRFLRKQAAETVGIFRKPGVRSRIQNIRNQLESSYNLDLTEFDAQQTYDVADTVKQYFRELPEPLLTSKLSETFIGVFLNVPEHLRLEAVQSAVLLLPDENREALQTLIQFLSDVASFSDVNQMSAKNLAVCFAPTLFQQSARNMSMSPQRRHKTITGGFPNEKELSENRAAQACLTTLIEQRRYVFMVPKDVMIRCSYSFTEREEPANIYELGLPQGNYVTYLKGCMDVLLQEHRDRWKGWVIEGSCDGVEISSKKVDDGHPLKLWRVWADVEAPPRELLFRVLAERDAWDEDIIKWRVVRKLSESCDILHYVCNDMPPHPTRDFCVIRKWLTDVMEIKGGCVLVEASVNSPEAPQVGGIRGVCLASRYLIEPSGAGRSRINHVVRMDLKGRSKAYYRKIFGCMCASQIARIRNSFRQISGGPETKV